VLKKSLSIIVPIYNVEKYLQKCISSLQKIEGINFEVLLINDGSKDNSLKICEKISNEDFRFKVISKKNGGLSDARNKGLEDADGEYIFFLDGDDYIESTGIEKLYSTIIKQKPDVSIFGYNVVYEDKDGNIEGNKLVVPKQKSVNKKIGTEFEEKDLDLIGYAWNKLYKRSFLVENNFYFEKGTSLVEDIIFNSMVLTKANHITFNNIPVVHYVQRNRQTLGTKYYENIIDLKIKGFNSYLKILTEWNINHLDFYENKLIIDYTKFLISAIVKEQSMSKSKKKNELLSLHGALNNVFNYKKIKNIDIKNQIIIYSFKRKLFWVNNILYSIRRK